MVGLILEGGGMRGAFTAGVLDCWMERGLYLQNVYGVSAGACQACSYLCHQPGRGLRVWTDYVHDPRFCSMQSLLKTGDLFGAELNYDLVPRKLDPLDNDVFIQSGARFTVVLTDVETGRPVYAPIRDMFDGIEAVRASASLPLISNMVEYRGRRYLDGGVSDSIPIRKAIADGFKKNVLVLTQAPGYRKAPNKALGLMKLKYKKYPKLVDAVARRHVMYNDTLDFIQAEQDAGRLFVLRPDETPEVGRIEKDPAKLKRLHDIGHAVAEREFDALTAFLDVP
ncbi:MAG: patatin family protein [Clostridia bacterium]|nr:patatin family protein [Clostridia bacterium]